MMMMMMSRCARRRRRTRRLLAAAVTLLCAVLSERMVATTAFPLLVVSTSMSRATTVRNCRQHNRAAADNMTKPHSSSSRWSSLHHFLLHAYHHHHHSDEQPKVEAVASDTQTLLSKEPPDDIVVAPPSYKKVGTAASVQSGAFLIPRLVTVLLLLLVIHPLLSPGPAWAMDQPSVDQAILGVPIPVPDVRYFVAGGICAAASHGVTTPVDVIKTRIQAEPARYQDVPLPEAASSILQQDGPGALLGGLGPTVVGYGLEGAAKFGLYESLKPVFASWASTAAAGYLGASVSAGAFASLLLCPMEQTRIRLVTDPSFAEGRFVPALARLIRQEGWTTVLFGGFPAMLSKQVPYTFCKQVSFDVFAAALYRVAYEANLAPANVKAEVSIAAAFLASILACIASHPGDVILTDTYKKGSEDNDNVTTTANIPKFSDVVATVYREEGVGGFVTGISARFLHVGAIITSQLVLYDFIKQLLGLPATGT